MPAAFRFCVAVLVLLSWWAACPASDRGAGEIAFDSVVFRSDRTPSGQVRLVNGEYREPAAPGSAAWIVVKRADPVAYGMLNGQAAALAVLITHTGGSGVFYDLALLLKKPEGWINQDSVFLGDRIRINGLAIGNDTMQVTMTVHGAGDPMARPTREVVRSFVLRGGRMSVLSGTASERTAPGLGGTCWQWLETVYNNDTRISPPGKDLYTLCFLPDGTVSTGAPCSKGRGRYLFPEHGISIETAPASGSACSTEPLGRSYIRDLNAAVHYRVKDDMLLLELKYDTGVMKFLPWNANEQKIK